MKWVRRKPSILDLKRSFHSTSANNDEYVLILPKIIRLTDVKNALVYKSEDLHSLGCASYMGFEFYAIYLFTFRQRKLSNHKRSEEA